jgi:hypothetical protein
MKAFFARGQEQWEQELEDMSMLVSYVCMGVQRHDDLHALTTGTHRQPRAAAQYRQRRAAAAPTGNKFDYSLPPDKDVPSGYICYRCGQKGMRV